jgi:hypothetical protein
MSIKESQNAKSQKRLIEWLREGVKDDDDPLMAFLKDLEDDFR